MRVLIVGAGIGGLTAAHAIRQAGRDVQVIERAPAIDDVGAGISLWLNAIRALDSIGLGDAVRALGSPSLNGTLRTKSGRLLSRTDYATALGLTDGASYVVHRADLIHLLLADLPASSLRLGSAVRGFSQRDDGVTVRFDDGSTAEADVLIGADGIRSRVRSQLFGGPAPRYAGFTTWRGVCAYPASEAFEAWGDGRIFGVTLLGQGRVYWYAAEAAPAGTQVEQAALRARFTDWLAPVPALIDATATVLQNDVYTVPPLRRFSEGRVALLGDAAHAMTPNLGQGGCQAIEDAVVLSRCLDDLDRYDAIRRPHAQRVAAASSQMSAVAMTTNPLARAIRDRLLPFVPASVATRRIGPIINHRLP